MLGGFLRLHNGRRRVNPCPNQGPFVVGSVRSGRSGGYDAAQA